MSLTPQDTSDREQRTSILLDAPLETVWRVWTEPEHIRQWWGPDGFWSTIEKMEVRAGGEWVFVMHGPDGRDYPNRTIFREVVPQKRIVHEHFAPNFVAEIDFEGRGEQTLLHWYKVYESKELFDLVEREYKGSEGFQQTVGRLKVYLAGTF